MDRPHFMTQRVVKIDYRRKTCRKKKQQEKTEPRIHSTNNKRPGLRLISANEKENG